MINYAHETIVDGDLGGCGRGEVGDPQTFVPSVWAGLIEMYDAKSVLDIGAGFGYASRWFRNQGCEVVGVEGSGGIAEQGVTTLEPHDYTTGPFCRDNGPGFDLCWCSEFAEHVEQQYEANWLADVKRCRVLALTAAPPWHPGHHHVNLQTSEYWIKRLAEHGFDYAPTATNWLKSVAADAHPYSYFSFRGLVFERRAND